MAIKPIEILIKARDEASGIFGSLQGKVAALGVAIAGYFGVSAFIGAVKGAADLEAKLSEVKAVSGATAAEMVLLRKAAEAAGASTKFNATEAADALGNLSRSGLSAKDSIAALPAVLQLAQAGGIGLGEAAGYVTKTVMGLSLAFSDAGRVADVLAKGANASDTSVTGLAQALSYAAPVANSMGLSLETTVAILGKFADGAIDGSRAGTALNAILSQFSDPASRFRTELAAAGITTGNFEQALRELAAAGPAGEKAILGVGTEAGPALRALLNQGIGALDDLKGKLDAATGSASTTAKVMEDNLKGSFNSLSSAWDSVKNALATPVLPVLKDGVDQLAAAFASAVSDGTIGKFGAAIATAFQGGIKWVREFLGTVDFVALSARMQAFATQAQDAFTKIGEYATNAGNIVKFAYGVMTAGANGVMTAVYSMGLAFSESAALIVKVSLRMTEALQKIAIGDARKRLQDEAEMMRVALAGLTGVSEAMAQKVNQSFAAVGDSAQLARDGFAGLASGSTAAATSADASAKAFDSVAKDLAAVGAAATDAGTKAKESSAKQQAAATAAKEKVATLRAEYEAAVATGNWQLAAEKMTALATAANGAKAATAEQRKKAEEDAAAIAAAFERMGIKTKDAMKTAADTALQDFERIKASGLATTNGLATAFKDYATKAIAANDGVATEVLKARAAMLGLEIQTDSAGNAIVKAMGEGKKSTDAFTGSVRTATNALGEQNSMLAEQQRALAAIRAATTAAPVKSILTKDDMKGVDNAGLFSLQQKLREGTLSKDDLDAAESAFKAAAGTLDSIQKNGSGVSLDARNSSARDFNQARDLLDKVKGLVAQDKAVNDTTGVDKANLELNKHRDGLSATTSNVQNSIEQLQNLLDIAKAKGDVAEQTRLQNLLDRQSIALMEVKQGYANREAFDLDALADAKLKQARLQGPINAQTSAEIQALRNQAAAKRADARTFESDAATFKQLADIEANKPQTTTTPAATTYTPQTTVTPMTTTMTPAEFFAAAKAANDAAAKTVNINLSINNSNIGTVDTSPAGSAVMQSFIDALQRSKLASGS